MAPVLLALVTMPATASPPASARHVAAPAAMAAGSRPADGVPGPGLQLPPPQTSSIREAAAVRTSSPPTLDGRLTEEVWLAAQPLAGFVQREPDEGQPATEATEVRVVYDDEAIYVGARMLDREPDRIVRRLSRRDGTAASDAVTVVLDPHHDHMTGAVFTVSAAGALTDGLVNNDNRTDLSWDGVWEAAVSVDEGGWTAEIRIPLSQLRFAPGDHQVWGFNVSRYLQRRAETSYWNAFAASESRLVSRCGHLAGIDELVPRRHLDLLPYASTRAEQFGAVAPGNPFLDGSRQVAGAGLDLKWGLTSAFTLDAAINPDFGQVEADPAVVNLTAFETLFEEKRPFFIEGMQLLRNFGQATGAIRARFGERPPDLVYSRRVGRPPQGRASGDFVEAPSATTILGAAKLAGRTASGWSVAIFDAVTGRESASIESTGVRSRHEVEPLTNYFAGRVRREFGQRAALGGVATFVARDLAEPALAAQLPRRAAVAGVDGYLYLDARRDWILNGAIATSRVTGSESAIARLQRAPSRSFQRPDAPHVRFDGSRTALSGWNGHLEVSRSNQDVLVSVAGWAISPGFESNDLGFQTGADRVGAHAFVIWQKARADRWTRFRYAGAAKFYNWNFGRQVVGNGIYAEAVAGLRNNWVVFTNLIVNRSVVDDRLTRGGPLARRPAARSVTANVTTDDRRRWSVAVGTTLSDNQEGGWGTTFSPVLTLRPSPRVTVSAGPEWNRTHAVAQYVGAAADPTASTTAGGRYVFSTIDRTDLAMVLRVNAVFTPRASFQVYAQPFLAAGHYSGFKELATPGLFAFDRYGLDRGEIGFDPAARRFTIDPDGGGAAPSFSLPDPDFNVKSLRVNAVFRWEWRLGSTFYAVWSQQRADYADPGAQSAGRDFRSLMRAPADNVFMVKIAYWLSR